MRFVLQIYAFVKYVRKYLENILYKIWGFLFFIIYYFDFNNFTKKYWDRM